MEHISAAATRSPAWSKAGLPLFVRAGLGTPYLIMLRYDGQMAIVDGGQAADHRGITELIAANMTLLGVKAIDDVVALLRPNQ